MNEIIRIAEAFDASHDFRFLPHCIVMGYVGSRSHGTYVPPTRDDANDDAIDDIDLMGIVLPPADHLIGLPHAAFDNWVHQKDELDVVLHSLHKIVRLLLKGNPNVLGLLWLREEDYLSRHAAFELLRDQRSLFAAKSVYASFAGYASGQLHRMTSYSPQIQAEMDTLAAELEAAGWPTSEIMDGRSLPMPKGIAPQLANEKAARLKSLRARYHAAYMGEKRRRLVVQHGYDTKNAAHLVRLLAMCCEFLGDGDLRVYRDFSGGDAEVLRAIKRGEWTLDAVKVRAEELFAAAKVARDKSPLPDEPDYTAVNRLIVEIVMEYRCGVHSGRETRRSA